MTGFYKEMTSRERLLYIQFMSFVQEYVLQEDFPLAIFMVISSFSLSFTGIMSLWFNSIDVNLLQRFFPDIDT